MFHTGRYQGLTSKWLAAVAVLSLLPLASLQAQERPINIGTLQSVSPRPTSKAVLERPNDKIEPSQQFEFADHAANGVAMRNRTSGTIHLRGIPIRSTPLRAMLYFNFSDRSEKGDSSRPVLFNGNVVIAKKTGDHVDPCWGLVGNHSYVADVTSLMPTNGNLNQDHHVVLQFDGNTSTTGQNPWSPVEPQDVRVEGATLILVYRNANSTGPVYVYDALNNAMFSGTATFTLLHAALSGQGLFTMVGADGQRGQGHDNSASNELSFFNSNQIAGPPVASSDWDGSDGWPLVQLWDTHTHRVPLKGDSSEVQYQAGGNDCLVPVAFVIDAN